MLLREAIERVKGRVPYKMVGYHVGCVPPLAFLVSKVQQHMTEVRIVAKGLEESERQQNVETHRTTNSHTSSSSLIKDPPSM